jgi:hypothetical protein
VFLPILKVKFITNEKIDAMHKLLRSTIISYFNKIKHLILDVLFQVYMPQSFDNHAKGGLEHFEIFQSLITIDHLHIQCKQFLKIGLCFQLNLVTYIL